METMGKRIAFFFSLLLTGFIANAQEIEMADKMRENGMIYVVIAVICLVFLGLFAYLIWQDRKLKKLEERISEHEN